MIINCISCSKKFNLAETLMPAEGSKVRCGSCFEVWFYHPTRENQTLEETSLTDEVSNDTQSGQQETTIQNETNPEETVLDDGEMKPIDESPIVTNADTSEELEAETDNQVNKTSFKIFTDEDSNMPSKQEMDENLDNYIIERENNLGFFGKLFKKDRLRTASQSLERKKNEPSEEQQKINQNRRVRLLLYLLFVLCVASSILFVPIKDDLSMMFPFTKGYFDFLTPIYDYIKVSLGLS